MAGETLSENALSSKSITHVTNSLPQCCLLGKGELMAKMQLWGTVEKGSAISFAGDLLFQLQTCQTFLTRLIVRCMAGLLCDDDTE